MAVTSPFTAFKNGKKEIHLGQHVLAEFFECDSNILNNIDKVEKGELLCTLYTNKNEYSEIESETKNAFIF